MNSLYVKINSIITKIKTELTGQAVVFVNVMPGIDINTDAHKSFRAAINIWLHHRCEEEGFVYADINAAMTDPADINAINPLYVGGDGIHPNKAGIAIMIERILPYVERFIEQINNGS